MPRWSYAAFALVNLFALWGLLAGVWLQAQQPGRSSKRGVPVFDEPLVNYMVGVREAARGERHWDKRPRLRIVDPVAVFPTRVNPPPPQAFPRLCNDLEKFIQKILTKDKKILISKLYVLLKQSSHWTRTIQTQINHVL